MVDSVVCSHTSNIFGNGSGLKMPFLDVVTMGWHDAGFMFVWEAGGSEKWDYDVGVASGIELFSGLGESCVSGDVGEDWDGKSKFWWLV